MCLNLGLSTESNEQASQNVGFRKAVIKFKNKVSFKSISRVIQTVLVEGTFEVVNYHVTNTSTHRRNTSRKLSVRCNDRKLRLFASLYKLYMCSLLFVIFLRDIG